MNYRRQKAREAAQDRLRELELATSRTDGSGGNATAANPDSLFASTTQGSWTTKDHDQRNGVAERDVYV